jgi:hypothetical protein
MSLNRGLSLFLLASSRRKPNEKEEELLPSGTVTSETLSSKDQAFWHYCQN